MNFSWWEKNFARVTLRSPIGPLKIKISTKILDFVIKIQKNITPLFRPKSTKLTAYLLFRIVQRKLYQKMGQIGQEMTELCHFYRNFKNGPKNFQKSKNSKRALGLRNTFLADLSFVLHGLIVFDPIFSFLESFWNCPKILKFQKMWKTWYRKTIRTQSFLVRFCSSFDMLFLI